MYTNDVQNQYAAFMQRRTQMETLLGRSKEIVAQLGMKQYEINLEQMAKKVHDDNFKVMVGYKDKEWFYGNESKNPRGLATGARRNTLAEFSANPPDDRRGKAGCHRISASIPSLYRQGKRNAEKNV